MNRNSWNGMWLTFFFEYIHFILKFLLLLSLFIYPMDSYLTPIFREILQNILPNSLKHFWKFHRNLQCIFWKLNHVWNPERIFQNIHTVFGKLQISLSVRGNYQYSEQITRLIFHIKNLIIIFKMKLKGKRMFLQQIKYYQN